MIRAILIIQLILCLAINTFSQTQEEEVMKPINLLFEGMKKADSAIVRKAFFAEAKMFSSIELGRKIEDSYHQPGEVIIKEEQLNNFLNAIGSKAKGTPDWNEKLLTTEIKIDEGIAQVWTEYSFFVGDKFSHCGVNAFQLMKDNSGWKIIHIMDTRRKKGCKKEFSD